MLQTAAVLQCTGSHGLALATYRRGRQARSAHLPAGSPGLSGAHGTNLQRQSALAAPRWKLHPPACLQHAQASFGTFQPPCAAPPSRLQQEHNRGETVKMRGRIHDSCSTHAALWHPQDVPSQPERLSAQAQKQMANDFLLACSPGGRRATSMAGLCAGNCQPKSSVNGLGAWCSSAMGQMARPSPSAVGSWRLAVEGSLMVVPGHEISEEGRKGRAPPEGRASPLLISRSCCA